MEFRKYNKSGYPVCMCYICLAELQKCHRFVETARDSNKVLEQWYTQPHEMKEDKPQITNTVAKEESSISIEIEDISLQHIKQEKIHIEAEYVGSDPLYLEVKKEYIDEQMGIKCEPISSTYNAALQDNNDRQQEVKYSLEYQAPGTSGKLCQLDDVTTETKPIFDKIEIEINTGTLNCSVCNFKCNTDNNLSRHMRFHDSGRTHVCDVCQYRFDNLIHLEKHKVMHIVDDANKVDNANEYICDICDFKCLNTRDFTNHLRSHAGEPITCDICGLKCKSKRRLADHMRSHTGEKPFLCEICSAKFALKTGLETHVKSRHTNEKPFTCNDCNYKASRKDHLKRHMRTHTGEKPFSCHLCDYRFSHKGNIKQHLRAKHKIKG